MLKTSERLCSQERCPLFANGLLIYMDGDHVTPETSVDLMRQLQLR